MKTQVMQLVYFITLMLLLNSCVSAGPSPSEESALTVTSEPVVNMAAASADTPPVEPTSTPTLPTSTSRPTTAPATDTPRPRLSVSGLILDHVTGQPVAGAEVSAGTTTATTGSNGRYTLANLTPGQYVVSVVHQDYDPALSPILFLGPGRLMPNLELYPIDETPYPEDPMLTNPINPNGAPTKEDAERLAREQGLSGEVVRIEETKLNGEFLVNYKLDDDIRAAIAELNHEVWKLTDETGQEWFIIKICGNLANRLAKEIIISTPQPCPLPLLAEVLVDSLTVYACASQECAEVTRVQFGDRVEVTGCLVEGSWCKVTTNGKNGWCTGQSLQSLAVSTVIPLATPIMPTPTPETIPAGKGRIIFNSVRNGERTHYIINIDGSGLAPFTEIHGGYGDWSSDGNQLVFSHETDIYRMNYDGSGLTNLTNYSASDIDPIWSPDDRQILFRSNRDEPDPENCMKIILNQCNYEIYVMNSDGSGLTNLTRDPGFDADHAWLQNGQIIFSRNGSIYTMNADGSTLQKLAEGSSPLLSPDGSRFVYFRRDPCCMWLMNTDGSGLTLLSDKLGPYTRSGRVWSPDGQKIVFAADLREYGSTRQIYIVNADGNGFTPLTSPPGLNEYPAWSPDGQSIAFTSTRDGNEEVYVMNPDGSNQRRLTDRPEFIDIFPRWLR